MSIVAVHGPQTFGSSGGAAGAVTNAGGTVTPSATNGLVFTFAGKGDRPAADYDWSFGTPPPPAAPDIKNGSVQFPTAGDKVITLTVGSSGGTTPAPGTYTFNVTASVGPRSGEDGEEVEGTSAALPEGSAPPEETQPSPAEGPPEETLLDEEPPVDEATEGLDFDPRDYTVTQVIGYAEENPEDIDLLIEAEQAGRNRSTLINQLRSMQTA